MFKSSKYQPKNVRSVYLRSQIFVLPWPKFEIMLLRYRGTKSHSTIPDALDHSTTRLYIIKLSMAGIYFVLSYCIWRYNKVYDI